MNEEEIKNLLRQADNTADKPAWSSVSISNIRHRAGRKRFVKLILPPAIAAVLIITTGIWNFNKEPESKNYEPQQNVSIESRIEKLQASTDNAIKLIHEMLDQERKQRQLDELQANLANHPRSSSLRHVARRP